MAQHKKLLDRLFSRFIQQKGNKEEQSIFWQWIWPLDARKQVTNRTKEEKDLVRERLWGNILLETQPAYSPDRWKQVIAAAAVITGITVAGWLLIKEPISENNTVFKSKEHAIRRLLLPDSTEVVLNANSSIQYSAAYNKRDRRVTLTGEGYFKVHKDNLHPFIVITEGLETQALGTAFNIEAHKQENQIQISLTEGKVAVTLADGQFPKNILHPGQLLRYNKLTKQSTTTSFTTDVTAWTSGGLSFNGIPLKDALDRLSADFQLQLRYSPEQLAGKTVTASFSKTSWQNALSNILFAHDLTYTMKDSLIIIH
ncbi:DUF4974 domain-containing protein [Chitinophaga sp. SYP-B3965]|uniref:FecR family protein n=1 Tax=Chitinophaga sp. SYP-B3965 TaxID=2663120 RepID=UPI0012995350|nr:FecR domain-containing protein [Chitinophaga sp. SYP-B3965]MRG45079.1 DUF4974 domain-containing protein [Chitinophaga sp. SYP-B3965]